MTPAGPVTRRSFLKGCAGAAGLLALAPKQLFARPSAPGGETFAVLVDVTRCISCRACSRACVAANDLHPSDKGTDVSPSHVEVSAFDKWSIVNRGVKSQCMHCLEPACVSVCPVGALDKTPLGPVIYRASRCIGCRYCMMACPFDVPKFDWESGMMPVIGKCTFCAANRVFKGLAPACADACPTGALKFGKRTALLFEAKARLKANPSKYVNHIYGEHEVGGTSWLYIAGTPFEELGFKKGLPSDPLPSYTAEVVSRLPLVVAVLAGLFGSVATALKEKHDGAPR